MSTTNNRDTQQPEYEGDQLYDRFAKPLERDHWGEFVAITPDGQIFLADTAVEAAQQADSAFGPGVYLFKVGERAIGRNRGGEALVEHGCVRTRSSANASPIPNADLCQPVPAA